MQKGCKTAYCSSDIEAKLNAVDLDLVMVTTNVVAPISTTTIAWRRDVGATREAEGGSRVIERHIGAASGAWACIVLGLHIWLVVLD